MYSLGSLTGPIITGAAMDAWDVRAFPIVAAVVALLYAVLVMLRLFARGPVGEDGTPP